MLYKKNEIIEVEITALKTYGAFAKVDNEYSGLIHISEINGLFIKDINDVFKIGDKKKVRILDVDEEKKQIKLSMILDKNGQTKKRKRTKLSGTNLGFDLFDEILPEWISSKMEEISCEENNKLNK